MRQWRRRLRRRQRGRERGRAQGDVEGRPRVAHVDDVIALMAEGLVLPYLDIPFQHASPGVLKAMRRPAHAENTLAINIGITPNFPAWGIFN